MTIMNIKVTFWRVVFAVIMVLGIYSTFVRYLHGLGAVSNMTDQFPWGLWIGFDCLCGIMLAAGGVLRDRRGLHLPRRAPAQHRSPRHAYSLSGIRSVYRRTALRSWPSLVHLAHDDLQNFHSVMLEVGFCVMTYTTVLFFEFLPNVLERFHLQAPIRWVKKIYPVLVVLGILLSTLHQSSLGSLYLIMPEKMHPFWYTPAQPFFFFISAIVCGLAMTIFESTLSARAFGRGLERSVIVELAGALYVALWVNGAAAFARLLPSRTAQATSSAQLRGLFPVAGADPRLCDSADDAELSRRSASDRDLSYLAP